MSEIELHDCETVKRWARVDLLGGNVSVFSNSVIVEFRPVVIQTPIEEIENAYTVTYAAIRALHAGPVPAVADLMAAVRACEAERAK